MTSGSGPSRGAGVQFRLEPPILCPHIQGHNLFFPRASLTLLLSTPLAPGILLLLTTQALLFSVPSTLLAVPSLWVLFTPHSTQYPSPPSGALCLLPVSPCPQCPLSLPWFLPSQLSPSFHLPGWLRLGFFNPCPALEKELACRPILSLHWPWARLTTSFGLLALLLGPGDAMNGQSVGHCVRGSGRALT